jgi:hypothetical protein
MRIRSRLNQARHAALDAAERPRARFLRVPVWTSAAGVTAAGVLGMAIWFGSPLMHRRSASPRTRAISRIWKSSPRRTREPAMRWRCCKTTSNFTIGLPKSPRRRIQAASVEPPLRLRWVWWVINERRLGGLRRWNRIASATAAAATATAADDESFIEFLGSDDVGDAAWWEFLKNSDPRGEPSRRRHRRVQSNDQGADHIIRNCCSLPRTAVSRRRRPSLRSRPRPPSAGRAACLGVIVAGAAAAVAELSRRMEFTAGGAPGGARQRQRAMARDESAAARERRTTAIHAMARNAARTTAGVAATMAAIQKFAA